MAQYKTCELCGANLDHGERCDCQDIKRKEVAPVRRKRPQTNKSIGIVSQKSLNVKRGRGYGY